MDLVERYLGAVRWNLPAGRADDIVAELGDLIHARIEDREESLGRPLAKSEISQLLKEFGHPLAVAGQYHEQRVLIGPEVFPFYWFALRVWLAVVAVIEAVQIGGRVIVGSQSVAQALAHGMGQAFETLLFHAALATLTFAVIERAGWLATYLERWKPEELPELSPLPAQSPRRASRWEGVFSIAFGIAFLGWWSGSVELPLIPRDADVTVHAAPIWARLYWPVVALVWLHIVQNLVTLVRPTWKRARALLIMLVAGGTVALAAMLHEASSLVVVTSGDAIQRLHLQESLDRAFAIAVIAVPVMAIVQAAAELWKLYRERSAR
ncbi:hypothetical protein [Sphingomonas psychrotolerans]|uniref:Uncharacterized protein n=1 Tax=Sphingomonas psychrotolerans TaxID=1327635 RepID=A0A2K8MJM2_9SPHN|nr:hypothetical protein [Sphingomonas psychrotolerans]ATY32766.1 hypothetical protein CVN68_12925 [Sphingomonas psychrotolerans]